MKPYPHVYAVTAAGGGSGTLELRSAGLPSLVTAPPAEFDGPGDAWSPETLLVGAVADCFILTFRAVARAARFEWSALECQVEGRLERAEGGAQFTAFRTVATLTLAPGTDGAKARELLERSERNCLVANSLRGSRELVVELRGA